MKYYLLLLIIGAMVLGSCRGVVDQKDFDDCIKVGHECVDLAKRLMSEKDSLKATIMEYRHAEIKNLKVFGVDERFVIVNK